MKIETEVFGTTADGQEVTRFTLFNSKGHSVSVMNFGATLLDVIVPDREGNLGNVNLSFNRLDPYLAGHPYFGSSVGRFCNRIKEGKFTIDGQNYQVTVNSGKHHIHGGKKNFSYQFWLGEAIEGESEVGVRFSLKSPHGEEGYPGTVTANALYTWNDQDELKIEYSATTDAPTHVNLTNHSYWNLAGVRSGSAMDHIATIHADQWLDVDADLIPSGQLNEVGGTPLDFRTPTSFDLRLDELAHTKGYDHCFVVRGEPGSLRRAAKVVDPKSGRGLEIETTQPGMQLYTANHLPGNERSNGFASHEAFCLETQHYPNAPNVSSFPTTLLKPGESLREVTIHRFTVE
ncbi:galactose mutarotase [Rhodopirellula sp.]|nr:aldose epimerase family protein [Rhodopirellula sp.]MDB4331523.1 galactose mutarotase [bacterium]MDB4678971.1 galactose mutarotase [Rhodopirellula sp.]